MAEQVGQPPAKRAKQGNDRLQVVTRIKEKRKLFPGQTGPSDGKTRWLKAKLSDGVAAVTLTCVPTVGGRVTLTRDFTGLPQDQEWVGLCVTDLDPVNETGYKFTAKAGQETIGSCTVYKSGGGREGRGGGQGRGRGRGRGGGRGRGETGATLPPASELPAAPALAAPASIEELIELTRIWFRVEAEDSVNRTRAKGARFERFMAWFMMFIWNQDFASVKVIGASHDRGRDIVCVPFTVRGSGDRRNHLIINCKNYGNKLGLDLIYTMLGRLVASKFEFSMVM